MCLVTSTKRTKQDQNQNLNHMARFSHEGFHSTFFFAVAMRSVYMKAWEQISMNKSYMRRHMHCPKRQAPGLVIFTCSKQVYKLVFCAYLVKDLVKDLVTDLPNLIKLDQT